MEDVKSPRKRDIKTLFKSITNELAEYFSNTDYIF